MDDFKFNNVHPLCANQRAYRRKGAHIVSYSASLKKHLQKISIPQVLLEFGIKGAIATKQLRENLIGLENNDQLVTKRPNK